MMEAVLTGVEPVDAFKFNNVVLMAPDIDVEVASQKFFTFTSDPDLMSNWPHDRLPRTLQGRITVYSSPGDRALSVSKFFFRSLRGRLGQLSVDDIPVDKQAWFELWGKMDLIVYKGSRTDRFGHSYFTSNPKVSSDLIQLVRYGKKPGEPGRPLVKVAPVIWVFPEDEP